MDTQFFLRNFTLCLSSTLLLAACDQDGGSTSQATSLIEETAQTQNADQSKEFLAMADRHAAKFLAGSPEFATQLGAAEEIAGVGYLEKFAGYDFDAFEENTRLNEAFLQELRGYSRDSLKGTALATYDVLKNAYEVAARRNQFPFGGATPAGGSVPQVGASWAVTPYLVTQLTGPHLYLPRMLQTQQPLDNTAHVEAYLSRLEDFGRVFDEIIQTVTADAQTGVVPPAFTLEGAIGSINALTEPPAADNPLVATLRTKMIEIEGLTEEERTAFETRASEIVENVVYPAYARLGAALEMLLPQAGSDAGVWRLGEQGEAFYQMALDAYGGGGKDGDEVHELGLSEVARITSEMDAILRAEGLDEGSVAERLETLNARPDATYPNTDEGREELLRSLRGQVAEIMAIAPDWFGALPTQKVEVQRIPVYEQDSSPGGYYSGPSLDGTRPGIYWINLKNTADNPKLGLKTLTYHEAVPGHHFQISLQRAVEDMPLIRNLLSYSEFAEGWALYGEALAKEMGMYDDDPLGDLGRLQAEIFRAARLVVDSGIHHKRWTREQAIDYMVDATGETRASVTREIERYAAVPGQACSYKLGMLRIQEMRAKAEAALGDEFDLKEFHDQVLLSGAMPMEVLDARITRWVASKKS